SKNWLIIQILIWLPIVFPFVFYFLPRIADANASVIIVSIIIGVVIGITEEILWRGVYIRKFPSSKFRGIIYPAIWFSIWHIAPQSVLPNQMPGGIAPFLFYALVLGLDWGLVTWRTDSIRWVVVVHCIHDTLGLSGFTFLQSNRTF
nr:CPBP family intramembrane metalloprotease [Thermoproteota archaeon]